MNRMLRFTVILACLVCSSCLKSPSLTSHFLYDTSPSAVTLEVYSRAGGVPRPTRAPYECMPPWNALLIRVWGDGLVYLDQSAQVNQKEILTGYINAEDMQNLLNSLQSYDHLQSRAGAPNPAGSAISLRVQLLAQLPIENNDMTDAYKAYQKLTVLLKPKLQLLSAQSQVVSRIQAILTERGCPKP